MRASRLYTLLLLFATSVLQAQTSGSWKAEAHRWPNVFLITIDTLRADHVGCYGDKQVKTPNLNSIAKDGVRFTEAFTVSPITNSSHASILTGDYPATHGVQDFGTPISLHTPTWAEILRQNGYHTAAFIGAVILDSKTLAPGFDRGFDFYDNFPEKSADKSNWGTIERRGMDVVSRAESWLRAHPTTPHFIWVHLYDPHDPYDPPPPFSQIYKTDLYDGEIAYADSALGDFLRFLRQEGWYQNALLIVVGDHGEGLGQHLEDTHGIFLYDSTTHVPLLIKLPGSRSAGEVVSAQVRTIDVLPTVLDLLGIKANAKMDGSSLTAEIEGKQNLGRPAIAETEYPLHFGWAPLRAARAYDFKFIQAPRPELYDLQADPGELHNLYRPANARVRQFRQLMADLPPLNTGSLGVKPSQLPDPKDKIEVQNLIHKADLALEYWKPAEARAQLLQAIELDPHSAAALSELGQLEIKIGDYRQAAEHLRETTKLRPKDANALYFLGVALNENGDLTGAAAALERSLQLLPEQTQARSLLGKVFRRSGHLNQAVDQLEAASLLQPENANVRYQLGQVFLAKHQYTEAISELETAAELQPDKAATFALLAQAYRATGNLAEANKATTTAARLRRAGSR